MLEQHAVIDAKDVRCDPIRRSPANQRIDHARSIIDLSPEALPLYTNRVASDYRGFSLEDVAPGPIRRDVDLAVRVVTAANSIPYRTRPNLPTEARS